MRISDWSSDVCSSDLCRSGFSRELLPLPLPLRRQGEGRAPPLRRPAIIPRMDKQPTTPRRALVTGGSGDLGGAICRQLAADGLHVIVHANGNRARAEAVVEDIAVAGDSAEAVAFDVADRSEEQTAELQSLMRISYA